MNADDAELLGRYATGHSEEAFTELIQRHVDLVYSAALRLMNGDTHSAQDVTQQVFAELARNSKRLSAHPALVGWLYATTRRMALRAIRTERRRTAREQEAHTMNELLREPGGEPNWEHLRPVLERAMHALGEKDRLAILLRFFQNKSLNEVGLALGLRENAARMRVGRALDKLRAQLARNGATSTSAALALALSTNAVTAAPPAFVSTITSASVAAAAGTGTTLSFLELMAITKSQLGIISAVVIASLVTPLLLQHQAQGSLREQDQASLRQEDQRAQLEAQNQRLSNLLVQASGYLTPSNAELLRLRGEVARLRSDVQELAQPKNAKTPSRPDMLASIGQRYSERVSQLKEFLAANPSESIPELRYMTEKEWLWLAGEKTPDTQEGYQRAMSLARLTVEATLAHEILHPALKQYASDHNGEFPRDPSDLKPYFKTPVDDAILQRWHILPGRKLINLSATIQNQDWLITQKAPVNRAIDQRIVVGLKQTDVYADAPPKYWETAP